MQVRAPLFAVDYASENVDAFRGQNKSVVISARTNKASFAVFLYGFLKSEERKTGAALCVYSNDQELKDWRAVATKVFRTAKRGRVVNITSLDSEEELPLAPFIAFVHCDRLEQMFPLRDELNGMVPFMTETEEIDDIVRGYSVNCYDPRAFASGDAPINLDNVHPKDPYSLSWDYLAFSSGALMKETVFYLNAVAVFFNRFLFDDVLEVREEHFYYNTIHASTSEMVDYVDHDNDSVEALMEAYTEMYKLIMIQDIHISFDVVLPEPVQRNVIPTQVHDKTMPPLRSIIYWQSVQRPCVEYHLDPRSRVSVLWVQSDELTAALRRNPQLSTVEERFSTTKTMMIYLYMWINHNKSFYVLCPYVSKAHELHKLKNARPIHPDDNLIHLLTEDDILIVFDTIFAPRHNMKLARTRCRLIFAAFSGTQEERALAKFLYLERGMKAPRLSRPFRMSPMSMTRTYVDPRRIQLHTELTSIIFYDQRDNAFTTLYECMLSTYNYTLAQVNAIYFNATYAHILEQMSRFYERTHTVERAETRVCTLVNLKNIKLIADLTEEKEVDDKNEKRSITRRMWTAIHNYYRTLKPTRDSFVISNKLAHEFETLGRQLMDVDIGRLVEADEFLSRCDEDLAVRVVYNENAMLLRQTIDNRQRPPVPALEDDNVDTTIECSYCGTLFESRYYHRQHVNAQHRDDMTKAKTHYCSWCNMVIKGDWLYIKHQRSIEHHQNIDRVEEEHFTCGVCHLIFTRKIAYDAHARRCIPKEPFTRCEACQVSVPTESLAEHALSAQHQRLTSGPEQIYCMCCKMHCERGEEMRAHLASEGHQQRYIAVGHIVPITICLNRFYILLAAVEKLASTRSYYVDMDLRRSLLLLPETRKNIGDEAFPNYCTLLLISMTMPPSTRKFYVSADGCSGILAATVRGRTGIVGHYGDGDKTIMFAELFSNMNVEGVGHGALAYVPSGLHSTLVAYAKLLNMTITRAPLGKTVLGRLGVYASYWLSKKEDGAASSSSKIK